MTPVRGAKVSAADSDFHAECHHKRPTRDLARVDAVKKLSGKCPVRLGNRKPALQLWSRDVRHLFGRWSLV